jgi:hypothetical protein
MKPGVHLPVLQRGVQLRHPKGSGIVHRARRVAVRPEELAIGANDHLKGDAEAPVPPAEEGLRAPVEALARPQDLDDEPVDRSDATLVQEQ